MTAPRVRRFAELIAAHAPASAEILEIGVGDGELARELIQRGYRYTGIDRQPRTTQLPVITTDFSDYDPGLQFDCTIAQYVLHHAGNLNGFIDRMIRFTKRGGLVAIGEYAWEESDDPDFRIQRADLHKGEAMLAALNAALQVLRFERIPYHDEGAATDTMGFIWLGRV